MLFSKIWSVITNITCLNCFMQELWQHDNLSPLAYSNYIHFKKLKALDKIKVRTNFSSSNIQNFDHSSDILDFFVAYCVSLRILE